MTDSSNALAAILQPGLESGFPTVEAFRERIEKQEFESVGQRLTAEHTARTDRVSVRAFWESGDPVGFCLSAPDARAAKDAFARVYATRLPGRKKNCAYLLPETARKVAIDIYDEAAASVGRETFVELKERLAGILVRFPGLRMRKVHLAKVFKRIYLANSRGFNAKYKKSHFNLVLGFALEDNLVDVSESRVYFNQIEPFKMVSRAFNLLSSLTGSRADFKENTFFILAPEASVFILKEFSDSFKIDGEKRRPDFRFPAILNIVDDPSLDRQVGSVPFDDEGVQGAERFLVRKGVLREEISNIQAAFENGAQSSGNGFRNSRSLFPGVNFSNLYIKPTVLSLKNLMKDAGDGILVSLVNLKRIDQEKYLFSAHGYRFLGDELREPVHCYFKTSFVSYFLNVMKVSKELRFFASTFNIGSPYILLEAKRKSPDMFEI